MKTIDLTHTFDADAPEYPGDPVPELVQIAAVDKDGYTNHRITTGMHVGTHIDAPLHMIQDGKRISDISPDRFIGRGRLIDARGASLVSAEFLEGRGVRKDDIVLVMTGFSKRYGEAEYYEAFPEIGEDFAREAVELGVKMVGMDMSSPDRPPYTVHKLLLGADILIIENLTNLESLIGIEAFEVLALPAKLPTDAALARVIARV
jgi:kynurenine formamidase